MTEERLDVARGAAPAETTQEGGNSPVLYSGRESVSEMMSGMMRNMSGGAARTRSRSMQATADMLRMMGCGREETIQKLVEGFGVSEEEAASFLDSE